MADKKEERESKNEAGTSVPLDAWRAPASPSGGEEEGQLEIGDSADLEVVFAGYLMKREGLVVRSWDVRYVCLCKGNDKHKLAGRWFLVYYTDHSKTFPGRGKSEIYPGNGGTTYTYDREFYDEGRRCCVFGVQPKTGNRVRLFDCQSEEVQKAWIDQLTAVGLKFGGLQTTKMVHSESVKEGWVNKCPKMGLVWNRRYLTLTTHTCIYSRGRGDTHAQGMIMITPKTVVSVSDKRPFSYRVVSDPTAASGSHPAREFIFQCADEPGFKSWIAAWQSVLKTG